MERLTPLAELLRDRIAREGPLRFDHFMEAALYTPELGYYRRRRTPFGRAGDFFTASQLQPVFGRLIGAILGSLPVTAVLELGPGAGEMSRNLPSLNYSAMDVGDTMPECFSGAIFANEFFDALPVRAGVMCDGKPRELRVGWNLRPVWHAAELMEDCDAAPYSLALEEGSRFEVGEHAIRWMERIARVLQDGWLLLLDYGYTHAEAQRFPLGSLMSYRRHAPEADVLACPGEQDITAHVDFTALRGAGEANGFEMVRFGSMAGVLAEFAPEALDSRERQQLKTLLFGLGESFRVLLMRREAQNKNGPESSGPVE